MTANQLYLAALEKKSVFGSHQLGCSHRPMPAAFVIGMPFVHVMNNINRLKIYKPKKK